MAQLLAGRYELTVPLGRGGMGQVWEATDRQLERRVAVKLLTQDHLAHRSDPSDLLRRFARESTLTAGLQHPGVPAVHDAGAYDGGLYLVMELVDGCTIGDMIAEQGPMPVAWTAAIGAQVCAVLTVAHGRGLVHRDIKPQNLMLLGDGTVKVLDFGVATVLDTAGAMSKITRTGETVGTPAYMAPEQLRSEPATPSTDLYALGCVLYEMLSGEPVFRATSPHAVGYMHLSQAPAPLHRADLPGGLEWLIRRLLAKDPMERPATAHEVYQQLLAFVGKVGRITGADPGVELTGMQLYARVLAGMSGAGGDDVAASPASPGPHGAQGVWQAPGGSGVSGAYGGHVGPPRASGPSGPAWTQAPHVPHTQGAPGRHGGQPVHTGNGGGAPAAHPPGGFGALPPAPQRSAMWKVLHSWWALPSLAFGFFTWSGFVYIGLRHQRRPWLIAGGVHLVLAGVLFATILAAPNEASQLNTVAGVIMLVIWPGGMVHTLYVNFQRLALRAAMDERGSGPTVGYGAHVGGAPPEATGPARQTMADPMAPPYRR